MLEQAALELGRFQGRVQKCPELPACAGCLSDVGTMERDFSQWKPETVEYQYLRYEKNEIPEHLRMMLLDAQRRADETFAKIKQLPVVLCHKDFWIENIFFADGKLILIDWDGAGFGYMGEDIASLIVDDTDHENWHEYYRRFTAAYQKGLAEHMDISAIDNLFMWEMIIMKFGYRMLQNHMFAKTEDQRKSAIEKLQKIYEMKNFKYD